MLALYADPASAEQPHWLAPATNLQFRQMPQDSHKTNIGSNKENQTNR
jgi:hypothetical protein